ncbi:MAG TPA: ADP-ribose pyrophosphatase [Ruminococcaceae bacterium]|nr:ADP-ribose pyrophosphatase [Oscillospiraceae bacterium]
MELYETTISSAEKFHGRILNLRVDEITLPNGHTASREVVEHPGGVCVAAVTGKRELLLVRQFRYPYKEILTEIPAGKLEPGEDPKSCGERELLEETGLKADSFKEFGRIYPTPGYCDEIIYLYLATGLHDVGQRLDEDEFLEIERIPLDDALALVLNGKIIDAKTQIAILKTYYNLSQNNA